MHILKSKAVRLISQRLNLPVSGSEQDWDVEFADPTRIDEFVSLFKQDNDLDSEQKFTLMALILASYNDALEEDKPLDPNWEYVKNSLKSDCIYTDLITYWSLPAETDEDIFFRLTPYIRLIC